MHWNPIRKILVGVAAAVATLVTAFASSEMDIFKDTLLRPFQIRWSAATLTEQRVISIAVHNASARKAQLRIHQSGLATGVLLDFSAGAFQDIPQTSYLEKLEQCPILKDFAVPVQTKMTHLFDQHNRSLSLRSLETILEQIWKDKSNHRMTPAQLESFAARHQPSSAPCVQPKGDPHYCDLEQEYEEWEKFVFSSRSQASEEWQKSTGLSLYYREGSFAPTDEIYFSGTLDPNATAYLNLRYGSDGVAPVTELNTLGDVATQVNSPEDLEAETWKIAFRYHPLLTATLLLIVILFWWPTLSRPSLKELPLFKVVNKALSTDGTDNDDIWDMVYHKMRFAMMSEFRALCTDFKKAAAQLSSIEVFDHLRDRMRVAYGLDGKLFGNGMEMEIQTHKYLRELAARI